MNEIVLALIKSETPDEAQSLVDTINTTDLAEVDQTLVAIGASIITDDDFSKEQKLVITMKLAVIDGMVRRRLQSLHSGFAIDGPETVQ